MPYLLSAHSLNFPPLELADANGLLAYGGDLSLERILKAYHSGIFPWYGKYSPIMWWSPDPRFVIKPENFRYPKSLRPLINQNKFQVTYNQNFEEVIKNCRQMYRKGQKGTWIMPELEQAFIKLHHLGFAHSVEVWLNGKLVGGLYGEVIGKMFFGESMFATVPNASKVGFVSLVKKLLKHDWQLIDCQVHTDHLERFGATMIPRKEFIHILEKNKQITCDIKNILSNS
ncbi:MAG: leucyl/phenylalanyl-tRNA--protein transferase [Bernardetiaceae bacterium]|nr:leucyl/phenylalanyl-tRNA--protein transferase [Bernardetiaceae bacterium]